MTAPTRRLVEGAARRPAQSEADDKRHFTAAPPTPTRRQQGRSQKARRAVSAANQDLFAGAGWVSVTPEAFAATVQLELLNRFRSDFESSFRTAPLI